MAKFGGLTPLKSLTPFGITKRKKKPARPEYSIDIKGERRKQKRVSIEELTERGAEVLRERAPELPKIDKRSLFTKVTDLLDIPRNVIANAIASIAGVDVSKMRRGTALKKVWMSDVLAKAGMPKGAVRSILGFVADVAVDPLTYLALGAATGARVAAHVPRIVGPASRALKAAARTGRVGKILQQAVGAKRAAQLGRGFQRVAAAKGAKAARQQMARRLNRVLASAATRGEKAALQFFAQYGEKGRTLFRLPFAAKGVGRVPFGAKARRYKAVQEMLDPRGKAAIDLLRQRHGIEVAARAGQMLLSRKVKGVREARGIAAGLRREASEAAGQLKALAAKFGLDVRKLDPKAKLPTGQTVAQAKARIKAIRASATAKVAPVEKELRAQLPALREAGRAARRKVAKRLRAGEPVTRQAARQAMEKAVGKARKPLLRAAKKEAAGRAIVTGKAVSLRRALETGPEAPGLVRELGRIQRGAPRIRGETGLLARIRGLKRDILGPGPSYAQQQMVGETQRATRIAAAVKARAIVDFSKQVEPIAAKWAARAPAAQRASTAEAVRRLMFHLAEAGPAGKTAAAVLRGDPLRRHFKFARRVGLAADPDAKRALDSFFEAMRGIGEARKRAGLAVGEPPFIGALTPEAAKRLAMTRAKGFKRPWETPAKFGLPQGPAYQRGKWLLFQTPEGQQQRIMSTAADVKARVAAAKAAGAKKVGEAPISRAQWNLWARRPETAPTAFGAEFGGPSMRGGIFREGLPEAAGARMAAHEQSMAAAQIRDLVEPWGVDVPKGVAEKAPEFAHLARPARPQQGNPMSVLERTGLYDRAYPVEITDMLDEATKMWDKPEAINAALQASDRVLGVWKSFALYHPAYVLRNMLEKPIGVILAGGDPMAATTRAFQGPTRALRKALIANDPSQVAGRVYQFAGRSYRGEDIFNLARNFHSVGAGRTAMEIPARFGAGAGRAAVAGAQRGWQRVHQGVFKLNTYFEDHQKLGAWFSFMDAGLSPQDAFMRTLLAAPDMADLPQWTARNMTRLFPWARWRLKNGSRMLGVILPQKTAFFAQLPRYRNVMEGVLTQDQVPRELRPDWHEEGLYAQIMGGREGGMAFGLQSWLPVQEAVDVMGAPLAPEQAARRFVGEVRPELKAAIEAATGQSIFRQQPLQTIQEAGGWGRALPRAFLGQSGTALDPLFALRPVREWAPRIGRVAEMPTPGRAATRAILGGAIQPLDRVRGLRNRYYQMNNMLRQLRSQMNAAKGARDMARFANLHRQYMSVAYQMWQWKMPLPRDVEQMFATAGTPRPGPP